MIFPLQKEKKVFPNDFLGVKAQLHILTIMLELIFPTAQETQFCMCIYTIWVCYVCRHVCTCLLWECECAHVYEDQRTILGSSLHLPPCLKQSLFVVCHYIMMAYKLQELSCLQISSRGKSSGITEAFYAMPTFSVDSGESNLGSPTCMPSDSCMDPSPQSPKVF